MALPLNERLRRLLTLLMALRNPRIFAVMSTRGFGTPDLDEGWSLFSIAAGAKLTYRGGRGEALPPDEARSLLARLDEWENTWFPVVSATLSRHFPAVQERVFQNLSQTEGQEVLLSVGTLLERLTLIEKNPEGRQASELLTRRGLTPEVRAEAAEIIKQLKQAQQASLPVIEPSALEEQRQAIEKAWAWYQEWSQIARTVITRGDVLIRMGLREPARASSEETPPEPPTTPPVG